jgi:hypothetical protein
MNWLTDLISGKPSRKDFGKVVIKFLRSKGETRKINFDLERFAVEITGEDGEIDSTRFLENLYTEYCLAKGVQREQVLQGYLMAPPDLPKTLHEAIPNVLVRIQPRILLDGIRATVSNDIAGQIPSITMADHYAVSLVFDTPAQLLHLNKTALADWGTTLEELMPRAITNLTALTPEPFQRAAEGVYYSHYQDTHDASRLTIMHRIQGCQVKGRPVAFAPNRNQLFITGENDTAGLRKVMDLLQVVATEPRPMPVFPLILTGNEYTDWTVWQIPSEHELAKDLNKINLIAMMNTYGMQCEMLQAEYAREKKDYFAANFIVFESPAGDTYSLCSWTKDVPTSLPQTKFIAMGDNTAPPMFVPFTAAQNIVGELMKPENMRPERYFVEAFPDEVQLAQLKDVSVDMQTLTAP